MAENYYSNQKSWKLILVKLFEKIINARQKSEVTDEEKIFQ